jgi:hypothetical protein
MVRKLCSPSNYCLIRVFIFKFVQVIVRQFSVDTLLDSCLDQVNPPSIVPFLLSGLGGKYKCPTFIGSCYIANTRVSQHLYNETKCFPVTMQ